MLLYCQCPFSRWKLRKPQHVFLPMTGTKEHLVRKVVSLGFPKALEGWEFGDVTQRYTEIKLDQMVSQCFLWFLEFGHWKGRSGVWTWHVNSVQQRFRPCVCACYKACYNACWYKYGWRCQRTKFLGRLPLSHEFAIGEALPKHIKPCFWKSSLVLCSCLIVFSFLCQWLYFNLSAKYRCIFFSLSCRFIHLTFTGCFFQPLELSR